MSKKSSGKEEQNINYGRIGVLIVIMIAVMLFMINSYVSSKIVQANIDSMYELALHDKKAINNSINYRESEIKYFAGLLPLKNINTLSELQEILYNQNIQMNTSKILLFSDSTSFFDSSFGSGINSNYFYKATMNKEGFIERIGYTANGKGEGILVIGQPVENFTVEGNTFFYLMAEISLQTLRDELIISSYNGSGKSIIIDRRGNLILSDEDLMENFFDWLKDKKIKNYRNPDDYIRDILFNRETRTKIKYNGKNYIVLSSRTEHNWIMLTYCPLKVFKKLSDEITFIFFVLSVMFFFIVSISIHMFIRKIITDRVSKKESRFMGELKKAKEDAEASNAAKTSFLFNMSHDIRTPMNAIVGFTDLLEKNQNDPKRRKNYIDKIKNANTMLVSIIDNILDMARIEKGTVEIVEKPMSIEKICNSIGSVFEETVKNKNLNFKITTNIRHKYVYCDYTIIEKIFMNLISNAIKYTKDGGTVTVYVEELPCDLRGYAKYKTTVKDNGIGMSKEFLPKLFDEFAREANTTEIKVEGTGLGMPIVKRYVTKLGGEINVESEKNKGTEITVTLIHKIASRSNLSVEKKETVTETVAGKRILLVEDNELNTEIAEEILTANNFIVETASDGVECLEMLRKAEEDYYDLILMDVQMPKMDGYETTKQIRLLKNGRKSSIPILAMTANAYNEDKKKAEDAGMNDHIPKPFDPKILIEKISRNLQKISV